MKKPDYIKENAKLLFTPDPEDPHGHGQTQKVIIEVSKENGGGEDCHIIVDGDFAGGWWVGWAEVSPIARPLNKTERKKLAAKVKADFNKLLESMREVQDNGLELDVWISTDDWESGQMCEVSYQPPTPPKEVY